nr:hypothetical protein [uncultured Prevotella sp.]
MTKAYSRCQVLSENNTNGTLVYPTVDEDFDFSYRNKDINHFIHVRTINLRQPWWKIKEQVLEIVKGGIRG